MQSGFAYHGLSEPVGRRIEYGASGRAFVVSNEAGRVGGEYAGCHGRHSR